MPSIGSTTTVSTAVNGTVPSGLSVGAQQQQPQQQPQPQSRSKGGNSSSDNDEAYGNVDTDAYDIDSNFMEMFDAKASRQQRTAERKSMDAEVFDLEDDIDGISLSEDLLSSTDESSSSAAEEMDLENGRGGEEEGIELNPATARLLSSWRRVGDDLPDPMSFHVYPVAKSPSADFRADVFVPGRRGSEFLLGLLAMREQRMEQLAEEELNRRRGSLGAADAPAASTPDAGGRYLPLAVNMQFVSTKGAATKGDKAQLDKKPLMRGKRGRPEKLVTIIATEKKKRGRKPKKPQIAATAATTMEATNAIRMRSLPAAADVIYIPAYAENPSTISVYSSSRNSNANSVAVRAAAAENAKLRRQLVSATADRGENAGGSSAGEEDNDDAKAVYRCPERNCNRKFKHKSTLHHHMKRHMVRTPVYRCPEPHCPKMFVDRKALSDHKRTHNTQRPFECMSEDCHATFKKKAHLLEHMRVHSGERPFVCNWPDCDKVYRHKSSLISHVKLQHSGPHSTVVAATMPDCSTDDDEDDL